jgi:hypothetical protein
MRQDIKDKWIEELLSGKYEQRSPWFANGGGYLVHILPCPNYPTGSRLPLSAQELCELNDTTNHSFEEIAKFIKENL